MNKNKFLCIICILIILILIIYIIAKKYEINQIPNTNNIELNFNKKIDSIVLQNNIKYNELIVLNKRLINQLFINKKNIDSLKKNRRKSIIDISKMSCNENIKHLSKNISVFTKYKDSIDLKKIFKINNDTFCILNSNNIKTLNYSFVDLFAFKTLADTLQSSLIKYEQLCNNKDSLLEIQSKNFLLCKQESRQIDSLNQIKIYKLSKELQDKDKILYRNKILLKASTLLVVGLIGIFILK